MDFYIQSSTPRINGFFDDSETLSCAIQEIFSIDTEQAFMFMRGLPIPLCYKYDMSRFIVEILDTLEFLSNKRELEFESLWFSDTLRNKWNFLKKGEDKLFVSVDWHEAPFELLKLFDSRVISLELGVRAFMSEWKRPLAIVLKALEDSGYTHRQLPDMERLRTCILHIHDEGFLYR